MSKPNGSPSPASIALAEALGAVVTESVSQAIKPLSARLSAVESSLSTVESRLSTVEDELKDIHEWVQAPAARQATPTKP